MTSYSQFEFLTAPQIEFGQGRLARLPELAKRKFNARNGLIVTDKGLVSTGIIDKAVALCKAGGLDVAVFDGVVADPSDAIIADAARAARSAQIVIGLGGGSSMDAAKLAAVLSTDEQALSEMYGVDMVTASRKPLVLIPTTAGTGSEVTPIAIVTTGETTKSGVVSSTLFPDIALLDPELTIGVPPHVTAATGLDAMVHAIEAYTSLEKKNPMSALLAKEALRLLSAHVPGAVRDGTDMAHRSGALLGAMLAGQAFANAPVAAVHALAYPLGGRYHLPHGLSNALVLPYVLAFNAKVAASSYAELVPCIDGYGDRGMDFVTIMTDLCELLDLKKPLRSFGIEKDAIATLAEDAMKQTRLLKNNPRPVTLEDAAAIYEQAW